MNFLRTTRVLVGLGVCKAAHRLMVLGVKLTGDAPPDELADEEDDDRGVGWIEHTDESQQMIDEVQRGDPRPPKPPEPEPLRGSASWRERERLRAAGRLPPR